MLFFFLKKESCFSTSQTDKQLPASSKREPSGRSDVNNEIENLLLVHEKKSSVAPIPGISNPEESESSDSEAEASKPAGASRGK